MPVTITVVNISLSNNSSSLQLKSVLVPALNTPQFLPPAKSSGRLLFCLPFLKPWILKNMLLELYTTEWLGFSKKTIFEYQNPLYPITTLKQHCYNSWRHRIWALRKPLLLLCLIVITGAFFTSQGNRVYWTNSFLAESSPSDRHQVGDQTSYREPVSSTVTQGSIPPSPYIPSTLKKYVSLNGNITYIYNVLVMPYNLQ